MVGIIVVGVIVVGDEAAHYNPDSYGGHPAEILMFRGAPLGFIEVSHRRSDGDCAEPLAIVKLRRIRRGMEFPA